MLAAKHVLLRESIVGLHDQSIGSQKHLSIIETAIAFEQMKMRPNRENIVRGNKDIPIYIR